MSKQASVQCATLFFISVQNTCCSWNCRAFKESTYNPWKPTGLQSICQASMSKEQSKNAPAGNQSFKVTAFLADCHAVLGAGCNGDVRNGGPSSSTGGVRKASLASFRIRTHSARAPLLYPPEIFFDAFAPPARRYRPGLHIPHRAICL